jgi:hypothetical protein
MTHKLWTESALDSWNEPAPAVGLKLFRDEPQHRVLVVYDEYSERLEIIQTRAYFLKDGQTTNVIGIAPKFVNPKICKHLPAVPVYFSAPTNSPPAFYAVAETNNPAFTIFSANKLAWTFSLPLYNDGTGRWKRIALTPVAATIDTSIVGAVAGSVWLYWGGPGLGR